MKINFRKCKILSLASLMVCCMLCANAKAEASTAHCYPTEAQIQAYIEDGTWARRQEYAKKLNHSTPSQELLYRAVQREYGWSSYAAGDHIPDEWKDMQTTGDARMLLVRVEFADVKFNNSKIYSEKAFYELIMGDGTKANFPYESLNAYYKRSSYNQLNITADAVYSCTLSKERDAYEFEDFGEQDLIQEVMQQLDDAVDFSDYDVNRDGRLDGICINFAGENTGWGSTWWSHKYEFQDSSIKFDGVTPSGYIFLETYTDGSSNGTQTLIHETGHLLGLPDYYSRTSDGIGTTDMMSNNSGDHNGFSKWLLGWIEDKNILRINRDYGDASVSLSPLSCASPGDDKLIAVIAPEDTAVHSEYFIVQYDEYVGNQSIFELEYPAYRVYHVDAQLNDSGDDFKYQNVYTNGQLLIRAVPILEGENDAQRYFYQEGDALTPDTKEPSSFYGGEILGFTGIEIKDFQTGSNPSFRVSFKEKEAMDGKLKFEIPKEAPLNMAALTLVSDKPLIDAWSDQHAYLEDREGNQYPLSLSMEDGSRAIQVSYLFIADSLKPQTQYTLVLPAGMFQIDHDVYSEECRLAVRTGVFPEIAADYRYGGDAMSGLFHLDETKSALIQITEDALETWQAELHVFEEAQRVRVTKFRIPAPEDYTQVMSIKAAGLHDGSIALTIRSAHSQTYRTITSFYKMDQRGNILAGPLSTIEDLDVIPVGNMLKGTGDDSGAVGTPGFGDEYKLKIYTIDFENEISSRLIEMEKYASKVYALDAESYMVIQSSRLGYSAGIFNQQDQRIGMMDLSAYIDGDIGAVMKDGDRLLILYTCYLENDAVDVMLCELDTNGTHLGTHKITRSSSWKYPAGWKMEKASWGYSLYNDTPEQPYSIYFLNDAFELISSMELPYGMSDATRLGSRCIAKWHDLTTWGYRIAITEPIAPPQPTPEPTPEPTPVPDMPSEDEIERFAAVTTGDESQLELLSLAMLLSIGIAAAHWKRYSRSRK